MAHVPANERREQLITAAISVIAEVGIDGATTRRIADAANAPLASLHYCFQSKEQLLFEVFEQILASHRADSAAIEGRGRSVADVGVDLLTQTLEWAMQNPDQARAELDLAMWAARLQSALGVQMYAMFAEVWTSTLLLAAPELPAEHLVASVRLIMALADGLGLQMLAYDDHAQSRRDTAEAGAMLAAHLRTRHGHR